MSYTALQIANKALGKIGGAGDQLGGNAFLPNLAGTDLVTARVNEAYPQCRHKAIFDLANYKCPFRETLKYADLGQELVELDYDTGSIAVTNGDDAIVGTGTVWTSDHEGLVMEIGGIRYEVETVDGATQITLTENYAGDTDTDLAYTITDLPEIGSWKYAFALPVNCFSIVRQLNEADLGRAEFREYNYERILDRAGTGFLLLTNDLTNSDATSAYLEYCFDQETEAMFSQALVECIATLLAAELCPTCGKDIKTRQGILAEYENISIPEAKKFNSSQKVINAAERTDYLGGRGAASF